MLKRRWSDSSTQTLCAERVSAFFATFTHLSDDGWRERGRYGTSHEPGRLPPAGSRSSARVHRPTSHQERVSKCIQLSLARQNLSDLGWVDFDFTLLPSSAWANENLAEAAVQLVKMGGTWLIDRLWVEHTNQSQPNPGPRGDGSPCISGERGLPPVQIFPLGHG